MRPSLHQALYGSAVPLHHKLLSKARLMTLFRFGLGGLSSSGITIGVTVALHELAFVAERFAAATGLATALTVNFLVLRYFVFHRTRMSLVPQLLLYLGSAGVFRGLEYLGFLLVNTAFGTHYVAALVMVTGVSSMLKFVLYEGFVFGRRL
jgi:putative flippase GtrA